MMLPVDTLEIGREVKRDTKGEKSNDDPLVEKASINLDSLFIPL